MTSLAPHTIPTPLSKRIQLARCVATSATRTIGITMKYEPAIRATCELPGAALHSGPPQKRNATVATVTIVASTEPSRPEPSTPEPRLAGERLDGRELSGRERDTRARKC